MDHLAVANWMFATVHRDEETDPAPYPEPVPRPGADGPPEIPEPHETPPRAATPAEIVAFLNSPG